MSIINADKLRDLSVWPGHIGEADFENELAEAEKTKAPTKRILVEQAFITDEQLGRTITDGFNYHFIYKKIPRGGNLINKDR